LQQKTGQNSSIRTVCGPKMIFGLKKKDEHATHDRL
jgi:hypothetical protein